MTTLLQAWRKYDNAAVHPTEKLSFVLSWDGPCMLFTEVILMVTFRKCTKRPIYLFVTFITRQECTIIVFCIVCNSNLYRRYLILESLAVTFHHIFFIHIF